MFTISKYITGKNNSGEKILSIFLTGGYPAKERFTELALNILDAGADMLEIGFPFSDPLADGPVIQQSSNSVLQKGINLENIFQYAYEIRKSTNKPIILMGYANPVLNFGMNKFVNRAMETGVNGIIIPDVPIEEYDNFFTSSFEKLETILLITPTTPAERILTIDKKSKGFVYCVSVSGTTGQNKRAAGENLSFIKNTYSIVNKNKMLVGFGISKGEDVKTYAPFCDGVIVGSAVIKSLMMDNGEYKKTLELVSELKNSLR